MPAPVNSVAPVVFGTATVGYLLSTSNGSWTNSPTGYSYQWTRGGSNISGATSATYETVSADLGDAIACVVTATNTSGSTSQASSNSITVVHGMVITNETTPPVAYWFGPRCLPATSGSTVTLDVTSDTSLYLLDDVVADAVNTLSQNGKISVSLSGVTDPPPFPRPTGVPAVLHGDGSPEGKVYAPQGSIYLRRDTTAGPNTLFAKTTGVTYSTEWAALCDSWSGLNQALGLQATTFPVHMANHSSSPTQKQALACGVWLNAGTRLTGLVVNYVATTASVTAAYLGIYNSAYVLQAQTAESHSSFGSTAGWIKVPLAPSFTVPLSGIYYFAVIFVGATTPVITSISGAGANSSQANPSGQYPCFEGSGTSDTTLLATASPTTTALVPWIGAY